MVCAKARPCVRLRPLPEPPRNARLGTRNAARCCRTSLFIRALLHMDMCGVEPLAAIPIIVTRSNLPRCPTAVWVLLLMLLLMLMLMRMLLPCLPKHLVQFVRQLLPLVACSPNAAGAPSAPVRIIGCVQTRARPRNAGTRSTSTSLIPVSCVPGAISYHAERHG